MQVCTSGKSLLLGELVMVWGGLWLLPCLGSLAVVSWLTELSLLNHAQAPHAPWMCTLGCWPSSLEDYLPTSSVAPVLILLYSGSLSLLPAGAIMISVWPSWVHSFIHSFSYQLSAEYYVQALCQVLGCHGEQDTIFVLSSRSTCATLCMGGNFSFQYLCCCFLLQVSSCVRLITYL